MIGVIAAAVAALGYGIAPVCARRAIRLLGFVRANLWRLVTAAAVLGTIAFALGRGTGSEPVAFAFAGAVGFGIGGICMFRALPLLGAPLAALLVETGAALAAAALAWAWFRDPIAPLTGLLCLVIVAGVVLGLTPYIRSPARTTTQPARTLRGVTYVLVAALAQAVSAVVSRWALLAAQQAEPVPDGPARNLAFVASAAFDRLLGGVAVALLILIATRALSLRSAAADLALRRGGGFAPGTVPTRDELGRAGRVLPDTGWFWVGANSLFGPVIGVTAMVWALQTLQPGVAQAIAATAPLIAIPVARWLEGYRPPPRYWVGAALAVGGLVALALLGG
jgi:drug/metabolite transporter (DMT)-like permease